MGRPALATTVHDPDARLVPLLEARAAILRAEYGVACASVTSSTAEVTIRCLREAGIEPLSGGDAGIGASRRAAVAAVAAHSPSSILYCDMDRWLHWATAYPDELAGLPDRMLGKRGGAWYACLGRTPRALATHPRVQVLCEDATNRAASSAFRRRSDVTAGAAWLSPDGASAVLEGSVEASNATDGEWPAIVWRKDPARVLQAWCEGLEFETATFHAPEIAAGGGREAWERQVYDTPEAWSARLALASATAAALVRVLRA